MKKAEEWERHIRRRAELGLTRQAYCEQEGISLYSWNYWSNKLKGPRKALVTKRSDSSQSFVQVRGVAETTLSSVEFLYPSGVRLRCSTLPPPSWVRQVV